MTMPPIPLMFLFIALLAWPTLKVGATLISRPLWREQRALKEELLSGGNLEPTLAEVVEETVEFGRGSALQLALPAVAFFGGIAVAFGGSEADDYDLAALDEKIWVEKHPDLTDQAKLFFQDERYRKMSNLAFILAGLQYPVCSALTLVAVAPAALLIAVMSGFRASQRKLLAATVAASRNAIRAFEWSFGGCLRRA